MKVEAEIQAGAFLGLSPKCYWLGDEKAEKRFNNIFFYILTFFRRSMKGVPRSTQITKTEF